MYYDWLYSVRLIIDFPLAVDSPYAKTMFDTDVNALTKLVWAVTLKLLT